MRNKRIVTSIDQVMRFLDLEYDPNLPCPKAYPQEKIYHCTQLFIEASNWLKDGEKPVVDMPFQELVYRKQKLSYDLRDLYFWERIK